MASSSSAERTRSRPGPTAATVDPQTLSGRPRIVYGITAGMSAKNLLRGQLRFLREAGWDVHLVCTDDELAREAALREGVTLHTLPMRRDISPWHDVVALVRWIRLLSRLRPDVLNVSTPKAGLLGGIAGRLTRVNRRFYVLRGLRLEGASGVPAVPLWLAERLSIAVSTDVICVSRTLMDVAIHRRLLPRDKAQVIGSGSSNGVHAEAVAGRAAAARQSGLRSRLGVGTDDFVVGFVGRLVDDKGIRTLLRALHESPSSIRCLLVGPFEDDGLKGEVEALGDRVVQIGWTDDPWFYYGSMDVLILPSRREGFPNVAIEAAASGVPCITTNATGCPDAVVDRETGLIFPIDDAVTLAEQMRWMQEHPAELAEMARRGRDRAFTEFNPTTLWSQLASLYQQVGRDTNPTTAEGSL